MVVCVCGGGGGGMEEGVLLSYGWALGPSCLYKFKAPKASDVKRPEYE